jgi:hypothetical protein
LLRHTHSLYVAFSRDPGVFDGRLYIVPRISA